MPYCLAPTRAPLLLKTRTFLPSTSLTPTRSPLLVAGLKCITFDWSIGIVLSMIPPVTPFIGFGRTCFLTTLMPSTTTCDASTRLNTVPRLPLSLPAITITSSPLRMRSIARSLDFFVSLCLLQDFRCERDDLHESLRAKFARHRPENAGADGFELRVQQHGRVVVELDRGAIAAAEALRGTNHHGAVDLALLDAPARRRVFDGHLDDI